jgi:hypothetical protein
VSVPGIHVKLSPPGSVAVSRKTLKTFDEKDYIRDDLLGFAFLRPKQPPWSDPIQIHGFRAFMQAQAFKIKGVDPSTLLQAVPKPLRAFLAKVEAVRVTSGRPIPVRTTLKTTSDFFGLPVPAGEVQIEFSNSFAVEAYDKSLLGKLKMSLASFATLSLSSIETTLDKIVTNGETITGIASIRFHDALVAGKVRDLTISRDFLFAEGKRYLYEVEIAYSPQTHDSRARWSDLQQMLRSFKVVG